MLNFLNLGLDLGIVSNSKELESILRENGYEGKVEAVDYEGIVAMYGGVRCSS